MVTNPGTWPIGGWGGRITQPKASGGGGSPTERVLADDSTVRVLADGTTIRVLS